MSEFLGAVIFIFVVFMVHLAGKSYWNRQGLPPSPFYLPVLGNLLYMNDAPHLVFDKLSKKYGKIFTFWIGGKPAVVINDEEICKHALIQQAHALSGRPHRYSGGLYSRNFKGIVLSDDDAGWRLRKKLACSALRKLSESGNVMERTIVGECQDLIGRLRLKAESGESIDLREDVSLAMLNIICALVFGSRYDIEDKEFREIAEVNTKFLYGIQCAAIVDAFPFLKYLPYKKLKWIRDFVITRDRILGRKFEEHKHSFTDDNARDFTDILIGADKKLEFMQSAEEDYLSQDHKIIMMGDLFLAGVETIATALLWGILYCVKWPSQQRLIQEELDAQRRNGSELSYSRRAEMPVMEAAITEIFRLSAVAPLGVPHKATSDCKLCGYSIPKGTILVLNIHSMNQNSDIWTSPELLNIKRYINEQGKFEAPKSGFLSFGIGKRACPGETLARMELFYFLANLLSQFDIKPVHPDISLKGHYATSWAPMPYTLKLSVRK